MASFPQVKPAALNYLIAGPGSVDEAQSAARRIAFWFGVGLVFVRFSMLNELLSYVDGRNFYLLYLFGIPALLGLLVSGGITRVLRERAAILPAISELAATKGFKLKELHLEPGRLDEVFRNITN